MAIIILGYVTTRVSFSQGEFTSFKYPLGVVPVLFIAVLHFFFFNNSFIETHTSFYVAL